jgi:transcriptional regulator with XRE-family HTH domain
MLANELNLSRSFIAAMEIGTRRPSAATAKRISEFLGYEFDNLFMVEDD